ncbi:YceD family protein [Lederbergia sp. NSJ-179]|uniref:YceD family protein n=1 Tax=Lederbergia sp. NSJ-179 TaxID=2931402 RepID=UPI001FD334BF|nr:YceD family protein [Lederbergia sp. NSJ-179]MCJ7839538.1 YceD family protein [Lederbergia sp. NSJ-179]
MKWTVSQLQKLRHTEVEIDQTIDISNNLVKRNPDIRDASPLHVKGKCKVDAEKVTFDLHIDGTLILPCSRTLVDTEYPLDIYSSEVFSFTSNPLSDDEVDDMIHVPENGVVDLIPVIEELILVDIPMQVFSQEALNDNMPAGKDWNVMTEEQYQEEKQKDKKVDPRLAGLATLLGNEEE